MHVYRDAYKWISKTKHLLALFPAKACQRARKRAAPSGTYAPPFRVTDQALYSTATRRPRRRQPSKRHAHVRGQRFRVGTGDRVRTRRCVYSSIDSPVQSSPVAVGAHHDDAITVTGHWSHHRHTPPVVVACGNAASACVTRRNRVYGDVCACVCVRAP